MHVNKIFYYIVVTSDNYINTLYTTYYFTFTFIKSNMNYTASYYNDGRIVIYHDFLAHDHYYDYTVDILKIA